MPHVILKSPFGLLTVFEEDGTLVALEWGGTPEGTATAVLRQALEQLEAYFDGRLRAFSLPLRPGGSPFRQCVWSRLRAIPYGDVATYGALVGDLGTSPRALAQAWPPIHCRSSSPCHRVVAAAGRLGGYSGGDGPHTKEALLRLEGVRIPVAGERDLRADSTDLRRRPI